MDKVNDLFFDSLWEFVYKIVSFLPNIIVMFLVVLIGVVLSSIVRFVFFWLLSLIKFDDMAAKWGLLRPWQRVE